MRSLVKLVVFHPGLKEPETLLVDRNGFTSFFVISEDQ